MKGMTPQTVRRWKMLPWRRMQNAAAKAYRSHLKMVSFLAIKG
jgi:hypothetical protein